MDGPSKHLSWKELACKDGTPYPERFINDGRVFKLAQAFEEIRRLCGDRPITILSAYRTPSWNIKVGGAVRSQHVQGRALDLLPPGTMKPIKFYELIKANHEEFGINGIGLYKAFVHIDIRHSDHLIAWTSTMRKEFIRT